MTEAVSAVLIPPCIPELLSFIHSFHRLHCGRKHKRHLYQHAITVTVRVVCRLCAARALRYVTVSDFWMRRRLWITECVRLHGRFIKPPSHGRTHRQYTHLFVLFNLTLCIVPTRHTVITKETWVAVIIRAGLWERLADSSVLQRSQYILT